MIYVVSYNYNLSLHIDDLQAHIIGQRLYTVFKNYELFVWKEMGIKIEVPAGLVAHDNGCDIAVVPLLYGNFVFPDGYVPVSGVYAIGTSCELIKPLTIHVQHCVELQLGEGDDLQFFKAEHDGTQPPYEFLPIEGGDIHTSPGYGILECKSFTLVTLVRKFRAIFNRNPVQYQAQFLYFWEEAHAFWKVIIFVIRSINSTINVCLRLHDFFAIYSFQLYFIGIHARTRKKTTWLS